MSALPKGWVWTKMLTIIDYEGGSQPPKKQFIYEPKQGYVRLLQIRDFGKNPFPTYVPDSKKLKKAKKDDLLLARYGGSSASDSLGRICTGFDGAYNVALAKLIFNDSYLSREFVKYLFMGPWFREVVSNNSRSCQTGFNRNDIKDVSFPLAPLKEQRRIVAKLEKLLYRIDACKERLEKIPALLKRFRQSVLSATCSGRLTADWREKNPDVRLECHSEQSEESHAISKGETLRFTQGDNGESHLPESWIVTALEKLCEGFQYGTSAKSQKSGKVPVLRMGNIQNGKIDWTDLAYTSDEDEINKFILRKGDVLFNRTNSPELVGKTGIYKGERPAIFAGYLIRIKNYPDLNSEYLNYCLNTVYAREFCQQVKTDGVSQSNVNAQKLGKFPLSLPPLPEQHEIVRRVESLFKKADEIEARYKKAKAFVDKLTQSILAKAFRGELVPQDPDDEPASVLLERIKAEKAKRELKRKAKKKQ